MINIIKNDNQDIDKVRWLIDRVRAEGGMEYAIQKMNVYRAEALQILHEFTDNDARRSLQQLIDYTISRKN